jgi:hypothetical protein
MRFYRNFQCISYVVTLSGIYLVTRSGMSIHFVSICVSFDFGAATIARFCFQSTTMAHAHLTLLATYNSLRSNTTHCLRLLVQQYNHETND